MKHHVFQIFKAGRHKSAHGQEIYFSEQDLQNTVAAYSAIPKAPLVLGHPYDNQPAYGQVLGLFAKNDVLYAQAQVGEKLQGLVRRGSYKKISASFYTPNHPSNPYPTVYSLRHVGFLGAQPPAIKGLTNPEFTEYKEAICFSEASDCELPLSSFTSNQHNQQIHEQALYYQKVCPVLSYYEAVEHVLTFEQ